MYGIASKSKHPILAEYGATPIDYRTEDFVEVIRRAEPGGLDAVFDGMGGDYVDRAFPLLRRGGVLVGYGNPLSMRATLRVLAKILVLEPATERQEGQALWRIRVLALQPKAVSGGLGCPLPAAPGGQDSAGHQRRVPTTRSSAGKCAPRKRSGRW